LKTGFRKERKLKPLDGIIAQTLKKFGLFDKMKENEVFLIWEEAVGKKVAAHATPVFMKFGRLFVAVDSSTWQAELKFLKAGLVKQLNEKLGMNKVKDIVFQVK